jgi:hypothetical protein
MRQRRTLLLLVATLGLAGRGLDGQGQAAKGDAPAYSLAADAAAGFTLAGPSLDFGETDTTAVWILSANLLHRIDSPGWGLVLSHSIDLSGQGGASTSLVPTTTIYEAYARLDLGGSCQVFVGKRRMGLGIGTTFAPGDLIDPRSGFWDQKDGFRGIDLAASIGSDIALRAALSLERNLDAYAAAFRLGTAGAAGLPAARAAYSAALDGAAGPADPRLLTWAASGDLMLGSLQLAASGLWSPDSILRPSLGLSFDLGGLIVQAEAAAEFAGSTALPDWYGTAGARWSWSKDDATLALSLDLDRNAAPGILRHEFYALPSINYTLIDVFALYARALVELEAPSALVSAGLTLYPVQGFDLELTGTFALGPTGSEFEILAVSPSAGALRDAIGLCARVHF